MNAVERLVDRIDQTRAEVGAAIPDGRRPGRRVLIWGDYFLFETAVALAGAVEPTIL